MKLGSKSEARAINKTRLTSVKSAKSAVLISEFGLNESENKRGDAKDAEKPHGFLLCVSASLRFAGFDQQPATSPPERARGPFHPDRLHLSG
jgi:hypothetical protein